MQRTNRNLLFGGRGESGSSLGNAPTGAELDAMEADNQAGVDGLRAPAAMMKDIAMSIERDVSDQNRMLDRMDKRFDGASTSISGVLGQLNDMVNDRTGKRMCATIGALFLGLLLLYKLMNR